MNILFEHDGILPVQKYGGTERVLFWLMKELVQQGHRVYCICRPQSDLKPIGVEAIAYEEKNDWRPLIPQHIDLIHLFNTPSFELPRPSLVSIEGNGRQGETFLENTVFVSRQHATNHGSDQFVYNGIDFSEYPYQDKKDTQSWERFLFLAKASWRIKNVKDCIRACKAHRHYLHIAGGRKWTLSPYIRSHGMVNQREKLTLLRQVDALLWPVRWPEPFGLAVVEAFSQGIPVISSTYGSSKELISEETGVLCQNYDHFQEVVGRRENVFNPQTIRKLAQERFSSQIMGQSYLKLYQKILDGEKLNPHPPQYQGNRRASELLPF